MSKVSQEARREIVTAIQDRYRKASKKEKERILDEFTIISGYHRKYAIRLMKSKKKLVCLPPLRSQSLYGEEVKNAIVVLWETADRICGKRLKALIPQLLISMEKHGHLRPVPEVREKVLSISAATIDRMLRSIRQTAGTRRRRKLCRKVAKDIAVKTFSDWKDPLPGYLEIDFVVHGGGSMAGEYLHSFVVTDVCSGWVEAVALLAREQKLVVESLKRIREQIPIPILGIDSDNDGAFINATVAEYCAQEKIEFTRSRPHQKNDQAWIEQKNGAVIRRMVGHERFSGIVAGQALAHLLRAVRLYVNYFQPSFKLRERVREGSKVKKLYHRPATPCDRLMAHEKVDQKIKDALRKERDQLDPVELLHRIRQAQAALAALSSGSPESGPNKSDINQFLSSLPDLWRKGEVRPTHRKDNQKTRDWRTREDPFREVWTDILEWLQEEPDRTAKTLLGRLQQKHPGRYGPMMLRTLQRRVGEWRNTMAKKLVIGGAVNGAEIEALRPVTSV